MGTIDFHKGKIKSILELRKTFLDNLILIDNYDEVHSEFMVKGLSKLKQLILDSENPSLADDPLLAIHLRQSIRSMNNVYGPKHFKLSHNSILLSLVAQYEGCLSGLLEYLFFSYPKYLKNDNDKTTLSISSVINMSQSELEQKKAHFIHEKVRKTINTNRFFDFLKRELSIDLNSASSGFIKKAYILPIEEITNRRHLITHNCSLYDELYIKKYGNPNKSAHNKRIKRLKSKGVASPESDSDVPLDIRCTISYLRKASFTIYSFLSILFFEVLKNHIDKLDFSDNEIRELNEIIDDSVIEEIDILINFNDSQLLEKNKSAKLKLALNSCSNIYSLVLERSKDLIMDDRSLLMIILNQAIVRKIEGREYENGLGKVDWSTKSAYFRYLNALVIGDLNYCKKSFKKSVYSHFSSEDNEILDYFLSSPSFLWLRSDPDNYPMKIKKILKSSPSFKSVKKNQTKEDFLLDRFGLKFD